MVVLVGACCDSFSRLIFCKILWHYVVNINYKSLVVLAPYIVVHKDLFYNILGCSAVEYSTTDVEVYIYMF